MSILPWHSLQADRSEERSFEALLDGAPLPPDASAEGRFLADVVGALTAPAAAGELAGLERARAAYATRFAAPGRHGSTYRRRSAMRSHPKIATALAAGVLGLGGFGAAAYAGTLPEVAQQVAHHVLGTPEGRPEHPGGSQAPQPGGAPSATPSGTPSAGPDPTGPAAFGLCNAWSHADASSRNSVAFANLAAAAGGADQVAAYCATVGHPGSASASHPAGKPSRSDHPSGKPTALPSHPAAPPSGVPSPSDHPSGKPTALPSHPVAPPSGVPSPSDHPSGKPTALPSHTASRPSNVPPSPSGHPTGH